MTSSEEITRLNVTEQGVVKARMIHAAANILLLVKLHGSKQEDMEMLACLMTGCGVTVEEVREVIRAASVDLQQGRLS